MAISIEISTLKSRKAIESLTDGLRALAREMGVVIRSQNLARRSDRARISTIGRQASVVLKSRDAEVARFSAIGKQMQIIARSNAMEAKRTAILARTTKSTKIAARASDGLSGRLRNLGSSAVFAVGPLSGIGARVTAFSAVATRSGAKVAVLVISIVALAVAAGKLASAIVKTGVKLAKMEVILKTVLGSALATGRAMEFLRKNSQQLGISFIESADAFSQLAAASKGTNISMSEVKGIFTAVSTAGAVLRLSSEQLTGAFRAIQQMMSKGTVQAEELRGQLGERLPGAFQIAARAMNVTTEELGRLLKAGEVFADDFLPRFAEELQRTFGPGAADALDTVGGQFERFKNAFVEIFEQLDRITGLTDIWKGLLSGAAEITEDIARFLGAVARTAPLTDQIIELRRQIAKARGEEFMELPIIERKGGPRTRGGRGRGRIPRAQPRGSVGFSRRRGGPTRAESIEEILVDKLAVKIKALREEQQKLTQAFRQEEQADFFANLAREAAKAERILRKNFDIRTKNFLKAEKERKKALASEVAALMKINQARLDFFQTEISAVDTKIKLVKAARRGNDALLFEVELIRLVNKFQATKNQLDEKAVGIILRLAKANIELAKTRALEKTFNARIRSLKEINALLEIRLRFGEKEARLQALILSIERDRGKLTAGEIEQLRVQVEIFEELGRKIKMVETLSQGFSDAFGTAFKDFLTQSKSVIEILNDLEQALIRVILQATLIDPLKDFIKDKAFEILGGKDDIAKATEIAAILAAAGVQTGASISSGGLAASTALNASAVLWSATAAEIMAAALALKAANTGGGGSGGADISTLGSLFGGTSGRGRPLTPASTASGFAGGADIGGGGGFGFGFAHGGSMRVKGVGAADSKFFGARVSPGERIDVLTPQQQRSQANNNAPSTIVNINIPISAPQGVDTPGFRETRRMMARQVADEVTRRTG